MTLPFSGKVTLPRNIVFFRNGVFGRMLGRAENVVISGALAFMRSSHKHVFGAPFLCWDFRNILFLGKWNTGGVEDAQEEFQGPMRETSGFQV